MTSLLGIPGPIYHWRISQRRSALALPARFLMIVFIAISWCCFQINNLRPGHSSNDCPSRSFFVVSSFYDKGSLAGGGGLRCDSRRILRRETGIRNRSRAMAKTARCGRSSARSGWPHITETSRSTLVVVERLNGGQPRSALPRSAHPRVTRLGQIDKGGGLRRGPL